MDFDLAVPFRKLTTRPMQKSATKSVTKVICIMSSSCFLTMNGNCFKIDAVNRVYKFLKCTFYNVKNDFCINGTVPQFSMMKIPQAKIFKKCQTHVNATERLGRLTNNCELKNPD
jgi:Holliday junction resolvasome RuvABC ATP-dependent DNA helicase subunit